MGILRLRVGHNGFLEGLAGFVHPKLALQTLADQEMHLARLRHDREGSLGDLQSLIILGLLEIQLPELDQCFVVVGFLFKRFVEASHRLIGPAHFDQTQTEKVVGIGVAGTHVQPELQIAPGLAGIPQQAMAADAVIEGLFEGGVELNDCVEMLDGGLGSPHDQVSHAQLIELEDRFLPGALEVVPSLQIRTDEALTGVVDFIEHQVAVDVGDFFPLPTGVGEVFHEHVGTAELEAGLVVGRLELDRLLQSSNRSGKILSREIDPTQLVMQ